jgi:hypothetical protein
MWMYVYWSWYLFASSFHQYPRAQAGKPLSSSSSCEWEQFKCQGLLYTLWQEGGGGGGAHPVFNTCSKSRQALQDYNNKLIFLV